MVSGGICIKYFNHALLWTFIVWSPPFDDKAATSKWIFKSAGSIVDSVILDVSDFTYRKKWHLKINNAMQMNLNCLNRNMPKLDLYFEITVSDISFLVSGKSSSPYLLIASTSNLISVSSGTLLFPLTATSIVILKKIIQISLIITHLHEYISEKDYWIQNNKFETYLRFFGICWIFYLA